MCTHGGGLVKRVIIIETAFINRVSELDFKPYKITFTLLFVAFLD